MSFCFMFDNYSMYPHSIILKYINYTIVQHLNTCTQIGNVKHAIQFRKLCSFHLLFSRSKHLANQAPGYITTENHYRNTHL